VRLRAKAASALLIAHAADGPVLMLGHGIINRLIPRELHTAGWIATGRHRSGHWGTACYQSQ